MKKIVLLFLVVLAGVASCSSVHGSSGKEKISYHKTRSTPSHTIKIPVSWEMMKIANYTSIDVEYSIKSDGQVVISGPEDVIDKIWIEEKGATLNIRVKPDVQSVNLSGVKVKVYLPDLNEVTLYGSGDFIADRLSTTTLGLNILGSGDISAGSIDATSMKLMIRGSGDVKVNKIACTNLQFLTQGSGDVVVKEIESTLTKVNVQGSGDILVDRLVTARAEALVQGAGDVTFHGLNVTNFQATVQGSGDITADGEVFSATMTVQGTGSINARKLKCDRVSKNKYGAGDIYTY